MEAMEEPARLRTMRMMMLNNRRGWERGEVGRAGCPRAYEQSTHPSWHPDVSAIGWGVTVDSTREMMNVGENRVQNGVLDCPKSKNEEKFLSIERMDSSRYAMEGLRVLRGTRCLENI
ncbi:hypothetical protein E3N88_44490 [Mikania micrantha]|uniref:Uncharacterized protein n=1 Tax=Mikania micrantha TaxID=192012 RepID=A0A5N6LC55_9ASTR|nr:hypothetical protein E3N88_44490 [Mikania micrantha]